MSTFDEIIEKCKKEWKCPDLMERKSRGKKLPFSSPGVNYSTYGGIPRGQITEFFGEPGGGKSTTAIDIAKNSLQIFKKEYEDEIQILSENQKTRDDRIRLAELEESGPRKILYIDLEHSFDVEWSKTLGIADLDIALMQPPDVPAEDLLQKVQDLVVSNQVGLIVLDSIPSLVTRAELEKKYGERTVASLAGLLTVFMRKIVANLQRYNTTLLLINQLRDNMDNPYQVNTPGGKAVKYFSTLRMQFTLGNPIDFLGNELPKRTSDPAGYIINTHIVKQKSAPNDRKDASYYLLSRSGIKPEMDYAQLAISKYGIIKKSGAWFSICDPNTGEILEDKDRKVMKLQGLPKVYDFLETNSDYFNELKDFIEKDIHPDEELPIEDDDYSLEDNILDEKLESEELLEEEIDE